MREASEARITADAARSATRATWLVAGVIILAALGAGWDTWKHTHWLFTWEHGFIRRGLVGTIHASFVDVATVHDLVLLQTAFAVAAAVGLSVLVVAALKADAAAHDGQLTQPALKAALVAGVLLASPGLIQQLFHDVGRLDVFGLLLLVIVAALLPGLGRAAGLALCIAAGMLAVLIHEAFALWVAPAVLALWYDRWRAVPQSLVALAIALIGVAVATGVVWQFSYSMHFDLDSAIAMLQQRASFPVHKEAVQVHFRNVPDNIAFTVERGSGPRRLAGAALGLVLLASYAWLLLSLLGPAARRRPAEAVVLGALVLAPLTLLAVGHDFGRWLAMVNATLALLFLSTVQRGAPVLSRLGERGMVTSLLAVMLMLLVGPFGVADPLPDIGIWTFLAALRQSTP